MRADSRLSPGLPDWGGEDAGVLAVDPEGRSGGDAGPRDDAGVQAARGTSRAARDRSQTRRGGKRPDTARTLSSDLRTRAAAALKRAPSRARKSDVASRRKRRSAPELPAGDRRLLRPMASIGQLTAVSALLLVAVSGCTGSAGHGAASSAPSGQGPPRTVSSTPSLVPPTEAQPNGVPRVIHLGPGRAAVGFGVEVLDPPTHTFEVRLVVPSDTDVRLWLTTSYGARLFVLENTHEARCHATKGVAVCLVRFPFLEAQRPGVWILHVLKRTRQPVTVTVTFRPQT
jgi:hypothetical protein